MFGLRFIRRATLDLTGRIPSPERLEAFLDDESPNKREKLVDELLASDEFVNYMSLRLGDILRIKAEFPINLWPNAAQAYTRFIRKSLSDGLGWDEMARRMLSSSGSNFRVGEVNFLRAMQSRTPESTASCAALTFMCARYDKIPEERRKAFASFSRAWDTSLQRSGKRKLSSTTLQSARRSYPYFRTDRRRYFPQICRCARALRNGLPRGEILIFKGVCKQGMDLDFRNANSFARGRHVFFGEQTGVGASAGNARGKI